MMYVKLSSYTTATSTTFKTGHNLRSSRPLNVFETKLKVIQNVTKVIDIESKVQKVLLAQYIDSVSKLIHDENDTYH